MKMTRAQLEEENETLRGLADKLDERLCEQVAQTNDLRKQLDIARSQVKFLGDRSLVLESEIDSLKVKITVYQDIIDRLLPRPMTQTQEKR